MTKGQKTYFTQKLMNWHRTANTRSLPWKEEKDPYKIWLSEIILQQTRAAQGLPYYLAFTKAYPTIHRMAAAKDEDAYRLWQGLGYYNRCRNMLATARYISKELKGKFPDVYEDILALKGVGPYTAAAIASFAYGLPNAVVDGNVYRVLARYFGIDTPQDSTEGKKQFHALAQDLLDKTDSAAYNQAIMDLGATVCTPAAPLCGDCPLHRKCLAYNQDIISLLPVKTKKTAVKTRYFHYILIHAGDKLWIQKRGDKDIWQNLHEPYLIEAEHALDAESLALHPLYRKLPFAGAKPVYVDIMKQRLTHRIIESRFYRIDLEKPLPIKDTVGNWVEISRLKKIAFPKTVISFLENKLYF